MIIPSVPNSQLASDNGFVSEEWRVFFVQLVNQLQQFVNDEGYILPSQKQNKINDLNTTDKVGGILYDQEGKFGKINTDGIFKNLSTYEELTTTEIANIPSGQRDSRFIRDTTTGDLKFGINDTFKTVTLT